MHSRKIVSLDVAAAAMLASDASPVKTLVSDLAVIKSLQRKHHHLYYTVVRLYTQKRKC